MFRVADLGELPWLGWLFVYAFVLFCFSTSRCVALKELVAMYSSPKDFTSSVKLAALSLGFLEDFVCTTYFVCALWGFDALKLAVSKRFNGEGELKCVPTRTAASVATFVVSWLFFFMMMVPFAADLLLVVNREMRFTFDLVIMAINEKEFVSAAPISPEEIQVGYIGAAVLVFAATVFASVRTRASWADLTNWNPAYMIKSPMDFRTRSAKVTTEKTGKGVKYVEVALEEGTEGSELDYPIKNEDNAMLSNSRTYQQLIYHHAAQVAIVVVGLVAVPALVVAIRCSCSPLVAYSGLNATLNELFAHAFQPTPTDATFTSVEGDRPWVAEYIHPTEKHELFGSDSLYRRTTGFQGDLAFTVDVTTENPPNVLVIGVESFRFQDSRYLVGEDDPSNLFKGTNMTITPNFDKWAKRGVALRNIWSSSPTSRSLESLLFAQVPYDSTVKTGITGGRSGTKLSGLPQLFTAKGYETFFTTGCPTRFENWDVFLPTHGYETVWDSEDMVQIAERDYGISRGDWRSGERRGFKWGVHDDINLQLLGDLLVKKTSEQRHRVASGKPKKPLFITHYTISSHAPFKARPEWYSKASKPDFSALYEGEKHADMIKNYLEMRHFTDMELGKFMDRMETEGILNDTIVVIMGDHGQAPEADVTNTHEESVTRVAGAIVAEGRLREAAGLVIEDAAEQYDILNTLADMTGVPEGGFIQDGIGRSLKRKVNFGERVVFSNDPSRKMSIVRGHQRLRYDQVTASMALHDIETDHAMTTDLFPKLTAEEQAEWKKWRSDGRRVTAYYTKRWDENCLLAVDCIAGN
uniref:Sulfatase N-terminal domain-containing protein n=1 Tax=Phytophthora ramorum TaxID=164328 RepID=H3GGC1_PHYRM